MAESLAKGESLPVRLDQNVLYYMGPSPAQPGKVIGSAGPTTSGRMDRYTPELLDLGLAAMIGKGRRSQAVLDALRRNGAVYFAAIGGAGALLSHAIVESEIVAYPDLGTEAIRRLVVRDFPAIVVNDTLGNDLYKINNP
jgi:fumarate hydratase subunit beta